MKNCRVRDGHATKCLLRRQAGSHPPLHGYGATGRDPAHHQGGGQAWSSFVKPQDFPKNSSGGAAWLKNMKLRNEPILKMQESPDFTDVKWRF